MTRAGDAQMLMDADPGDEVEPWGLLSEIGISGLRRTGGYIDEEFLRQLSGRKGARIYREMGDNNPQINGWYMAVSELLRGIEWSVEPPSNRGEGKRAGDFLESSMEDMEHSWGDMITEICTFVKYGWELSELLYKRRVGPWESDPLRKSKFKDQMIGWRAIEGRAQESLLRWKFDEFGKILAMVQLAAPRYQKRVLPMGKCLLFRTTKAKNNPEGHSLLRGCYEPYYYLKRFREIEAVGVSRDLAGIPVANVPSEILGAKPGTKNAQMLAEMTKLVRTLNRNEQEGVVWPYDVDEETKLPKYKLELLNSGGSRQFDTSGIIDRCKTEILQALLADFIQVGHEDNGGSYALHTDKQGLFRTSINALAERIADEFNRNAIPRLFELNQWRLDELPRIVPSSVDPPDLSQLATFMSAAGGLGMQFFPDPTLDAMLRQAAGLPKLDPAIENMLEVQQRQQAVLNLATQKMQAVQLEQQAAQGELGVAQQAQGVAQTQQQLEAGPEQDQADPNDAKRSNIAVDTDKVKLSQEKQKLANLKKPATTRPASKPARKPVGKAIVGRGVRPAWYDGIGARR